MLCRRLACAMLAIKGNNSATLPTIPTPPVHDACVRSHRYYHDPFTHSLPPSTRLFCRLSYGRQIGKFYFIPPTSASPKWPRTKTRKLTNTPQRARVVRRPDSYVRNEDKITATRHFFALSCKRTRSRHSVRGPTKNSHPHSVHHSLRFKKTQQKLFVA